MKFVTYWVLASNKATIFNYQQPKDMQNVTHRHFSMLMHPVLPHEVPLP